MGSLRLGGRPLNVFLLLLLLPSRLLSYAVPPRALPAPWGRRPVALHGVSRAGLSCICNYCTRSCIRSSCSQALGCQKIEPIPFSRTSFIPVTAPPGHPAL